MKCENCGYVTECPSCAESPIPQQTGYELWIDVYQRNTGQDWKLLKENGVAGVCAKIGYGWDAFRGASGSTFDSKFKEHIDGARLAGLKVAGYWWSDPLESWTRQVEYILTACKDADLDWFAADMELEYGYFQVYDKRKQKYVWALSRIDGAKHSGCNKYILDKVQEALGIKGYLYSNPKFINGIASQVQSWMKDYGLWLSHTPVEHVYTCNRIEAAAKRFTYCPTWDEWKEKYMLTPNGTWKPTPPKVKDWDMWQFSMDKVKLPGSQSFMDLNWKKA